VCVLPGKATRGTDRITLLRLLRTSVRDHVADKKTLSDQIISFTLREKLGNIRSRKPRAAFEPF
jgi:hypothetical protein